MGRGSIAARPHVDLTRVSFGMGDELGDRLGRNRRMHHYDEGCTHDARNRCDVTEAAELLRVSPITLGRWRIEGRGPPFRRFGRRVVYARCDLLSWADAQTHLSTSEPCCRKPDRRISRDPRATT